VLRAAGEASRVAVGGDYPIALALPAGMAEGQAVQVAIRPESLRLGPLPPAAGEAGGAVPGKVAEVTFLGNITDCHVTLPDGTRVRVQAAPGEVLEVGQPVWVSFDREASSVFGA
jgi:ABC-type Fe3+/spermidine/putrescine transport system ATPase subunit